MEKAKVLSTAFVAVIFLCTSCSQSIVADQTDYSSLSKKELIKRVFEAKKMKEIYDQTTLSNLTASFESGPSGALMFDRQKEDIANAMSNIIQEHLSWDQLETEIYYPLYDSLYSKSDLERILPILESDSFGLLVGRDLSIIAEATQRTHEMTSELMPLFTQTIMEIMGSGPEQNPMPSPKRN